MRKTLVSAILFLPAFGFAAAGSAEDAARPPLGVFTEQGRPFVIYLDVSEGEDAAAKINEAIGDVRKAGGGTIVLRPGSLEISSTINMAGPLERFPSGSPRGIVLTGAGGGKSTTLIWAGPEGEPVIDLPSPWDCQVKNLDINGRNVPGAIGIRLRGGYERDANSGKNNLFENMTIVRLDVCIEIGDPYGPDLVGATFRNIWLMYMNIGVRAMGSNVTGIVFENCALTGYQQAGFKIVGYTARLIRESADDPMPEPEQPGEPAVLMAPGNQREIFLHEVPEYALKRMTINRSHRGWAPRTWVGGGAPDITCYSLIGHARDPTTWMFDTNWGTIRVYTARVEGPGGIFRANSNEISGRFNDTLVDVTSTSPGGLTGNSIEYHRQGPLYLIGGTYEANISLGQDTIVYSMGAKFFERRTHAGGAIHPDYQIPEGIEATRTGETKLWPGRRGMYDLVTFDYPEDIGFKQLPGTSGAQIHEMSPTLVKTVKVPEGKQSNRVELSGMESQPGAYQVFVTPNFDTGGFWISEKREHGFVIHFKNAAPARAEADLLIQRSPFRVRKLPKKKSDFHDSEKKK